MKILHTSDWHLGKMIYGRSLLQDQAHFIKEIFLPTVQKEQPDCVILAGDIFDRQIAPVEAIRMFDEVLTEMSRLQIPLLLFPVIMMVLIVLQWDPLCCAVAVFTLLPN